MNNRRLYYKAWLDTRGRFAIGLVALTCLAALTVSIMARRLSPGHGWPVEQVARVLHDTWFETLPPLWCLFAILLGSGGLVPQGHRGGGVFMLSLPARRIDLLLTRVVVAMVELYLLALLPSLSLMLWVPALVGGHYASLEVFVAAFSLFAGGTIFFAVPFFLATVVEQVWGPLAVMLSLFIIITFLRDLDPDLARFTLAPLLNARGYLDGESLPWLGLIDVVAVSAALIALAVRNIARRDF